jgi:CxxC motif-containing protein (DUF1111 family)
MSIKSDHPITPPLELVQEWGHDANLSGVPYDDETGHWAYEQHIATQAARWGADQELEACCEWFKKEGWNSCHPEALVATRRPQPPSLKEQALLQLDTLNADLAMHGMGCDLSQIRRALEALPDD